MSSRWIAVVIGALLASQEATAACELSGARPTVPLPTMLDGQEFSFIASRDCATLRFTIRSTDVSKNPMSGGPVGPGLHTYKVVLTESEWNGVVADSGSTLTWVVTGRTSAGVVTRMVTTNDLKDDDTITLDLSTADAKFVGEDFLGAGDVSDAGDVDGDGHDDVLIGPWFFASGITGAAYLVLGPVTGTLDLAGADAKLVGEAADDCAGCDISGAGDVDGDGRDDLLLGAYGNDEGGTSSGAAYLVLGPVTGTLSLALADAKLVGDEATFAGRRVSSAGDVDGNGHDDLLIGTAENEESAAYLVLGPVTGTLDLSLADAKFVHTTQDSCAGDVDGDGHSDLLFGASTIFTGSDAGAAFLVLGPVTGTLDLSSMADATLVGEDAGDWAGDNVSDAGDVDSDGHDDLLVGALRNSEGAHYAGAAYLVLGPVTGSRDLSLADAKFLGENPFDYAGTVSGAGDVDGDGHDDLLVGAMYNGQGGSDAGAAYLVLGPVTGTLDLSQADVKLVGEDAYDHAGETVSGAGDVDGDGRADLLVGAPWADDYVGNAYLIYGGASDSSAHGHEPTRDGRHEVEPCPVRGS
jgi:hypothetical protein